jgi:arginyl-tRNA synthetase
MIKSRIKILLDAGAEALGAKEKENYNIDVPPRKELGDYASNIAILYARKLSKNPMEIAEKVCEQIRQKDTDRLFQRIDFARPGFVNFTLSDSFLKQALDGILKQDFDWGKSRRKNKEKVLLEFVSANPTGPLHVGHGRWAVVGDVIARLLKSAGYFVDTEFYVNNVGAQVEKLEASVRALRAGKEIPEGGYGGAYISEVKGETKNEMLENLIRQQKDTLHALGVEFNKWFFESELHKAGKILLAIEKLHDLGATFEEEGAIWFKSQSLGDDKNRVLMREDGRPTYFAADIAYHLDKFARGYDRLINIWGTDHHGYVGRLKAAMKVLGAPVGNFEIIIGQLVTLYRGKEPVRMSKRTGEMITLQEVIDEIGADATRFFFSATDVNSHLDFDLELAKKKSHENPVFYVQYAHARICSILKKSQIPNPKSQSNVDLSSLNHPAERELMLKLAAWPDVVEEAARLRHPHRITEFGKELATVFHSFYEKCKVLGNPARLILVDASRITLRNVLQLLGISAPESM